MDLRGSIIDVVTRHYRKHKHQKLAFTMEKNASFRKSDHHPKNNTTPLYRGNVRSRIFHRPGCRYFNCTDCAIEFHSREDALEAGYIPCSKCSP